MSGKNSGEAVQLTDRIKFINADCMDIMAQYSDKYFDLAIVDPPYGIGASNDKFTRQGKQTGKSLAISGIKYNHKTWDNKKPTQFYFQELTRVTKNQIVWGGNYFSHLLNYSSCWLVWDKLTGDNLYADCELAWTSFNTPVRKYDFMWKGMFQGDMKNKEERIHPTQKPVKLYEWIYHNYAKPEFKILDTHLGSGSNAIAAHNYGIAEFVGIELDPEYYADSIKRFNRVTSQLRMF